MSRPTFKPGDTVYNQRGHEALLIAYTGGEFIVRPIYEDDDGPQEGDVETWTVAFRTPPAPKLDADTAAAEKKLAEINAQVSEARSVLNELNRGEKARQERIKLHDELAELDRYLAGEITHYVTTHDYYPIVDVLPVEETVESYASNNKYGLLTLYPSRGWDKKIRWSVSYRGKDYYQSYKTEKVIPCCSEEAAHEMARKVLRHNIETALAKGPEERHYVAELIKCCGKFGVEVPQEIIDGEAEQRCASLDRQIADHEKKAAELRAARAMLAQGGAA